MHADNDKRENRCPIQNLTDLWIDSNQELQLTSGVSAWIWSQYRLKRSTLDVAGRDTPYDITKLRSVAVRHFEMKCPFS